MQISGGGTLQAEKQQGPRSLSKGVSWCVCLNLTFSSKSSPRLYLHEAFFYFFPSKNYIFCLYLYIYGIYGTFIYVCVYTQTHMYTHTHTHTHTYIYIYIYIYTSILHICIFQPLPLSDLQCTCYQCFFFPLTLF